MIHSDTNAVVIKWYVQGEYVGGPTVEASGRNPRWFVIRVGGDDYYAQEARLEVEQAAQLRDMLNAWLVQQ